MIWRPRYRVLIEASRSAISRLRTRFAEIPCWGANRFIGGRSWLGFLGALAVLLYAFLGISAPGDSQGNLFMFLNQ